MEGGEVKAVNFLGLVLMNHLLQQPIQIILVLHGLPQNGQLKKYGNQKQHQKINGHKTISGKTPSEFTILSGVKPSYFRFSIWFMSFLKFDLPQL